MMPCAIAGLSVPGIGRVVIVATSIVVVDAVVRSSFFEVALPYLRLALLIFVFLSLFTNPRGEELLSLLCLIVTCYWCERGVKCPRSRSTSVKTTAAAANRLNTYT
jgi:hypothetical protein